MLDGSTLGVRDVTGNWVPDRRCDFGCHAGFERVELVGASLDTHGDAHCLHHKYFEVNHSDGIVPLDRWFGSFHDGSPEAMERMRSRRPAAAAHA